MIILIFILLILGLSYICLSMKKHQLQTLPNKTDPTHSMLALILGYLLLAISCFISIYHWGIGIGLVLYMVIFTIAHLSSILLVTYLPRQLSLFSGFYWLFHRTNIIK